MPLPLRSASANWPAVLLSLRYGPVDDNALSTKHSSAYRHSTPRTVGAVARPAGRGHVPRTRGAPLPSRTHPNVDSTPWYLGKDTSLQVSCLRIVLSTESLLVHNQVRYTIKCAQVPCPCTAGRLLVPQECRSPDVGALSSCDPHLPLSGLTWQLLRAWASKSNGAPPERTTLSLQLLPTGLTCLSAMAQQGQDGGQPVGLERRPLEPYWASKRPTTPDMRHTWAMDRACVAPELTNRHTAASQQIP